MLKNIECPTTALSIVFIVASIRYDLQAVSLLLTVSINVKDQAQNRLKIARPASMMTMSSTDRFTFVSNKTKMIWIINFARAGVLLTAAIPCQSNSKTRCLS